jgi:hypothetical protein
MAHTVRSLTVQSLKNPCPHPYDPRIWIADRLAAFKVAVADPECRGALLTQAATQAIIGIPKPEVLDGLYDQMEAGIFPTLFEVEFDDQGRIKSEKLTKGFEPLKIYFEKMARVHHAVTGLRYIYDRAGRNLHQDEHPHPYAVTHIALDSTQGLGWVTEDKRKVFAPPNWIFHMKSGLWHLSPEDSNKISIAAHGSMEYEKQKF